MKPIVKYDVFVLVAYWFTCLSHKLEVEGSAQRANKKIFNI